MKQLRVVRRFQKSGTRYRLRRKYPASDQLPAALEDFCSPLGLSTGSWLPALKMGFSTCSSVASSRALTAEEKAGVLFLDDRLEAELAHSFQKVLRLILGMRM